MHYPVDCSDWYFTDYNWARHITGDGVEARTAVNPGAYFKIRFTGGSATLCLDQSRSITGIGLAFHVDEGAWQTAVVTYDDKCTIPLFQSSAPVAGEPEAQEHTLVLFIENSDEDSDRWGTAAELPRCRLTVTGLLLGAGAMLLPVRLRTSRLLAFGDSITEGIRTKQADPLTDSLVAAATNNPLHMHSATCTWAMALGEALGAEVSVVGFGRQGWVTNGKGGVPKFCDPESMAGAWKSVFAGHPREMQPCPDFVFVLHGTNDGMQEKKDHKVVASALAWLEQVRRACPTTSLFLCVPFGGFQRSNLQEAYQQFSNQVQLEGLQHTWLVDLGVEAEAGLSRWGVSRAAWDGIHPTAVRSTQLGGMLAAKALAAKLSTNPNVVRKSP